LQEDEQAAIVIQRAVRCKQQKLFEKKFATNCSDMTACSLQSNKGKRKYTKLDLQDLLNELQKNPEIAIFCACNDF